MADVIAELRARIEAASEPGLASDFESSLEAERIRLTAAQAEAQERKNREADGELCEMELALSVLFETQRAQRDAWLSWPSRVAPFIAAKLGIDGDRLRHELDEHVHQQCADLGESSGDEFACASEAY